MAREAEPRCAGWFTLHPSVLADAGLAAALQERLDRRGSLGRQSAFSGERQIRLPPASERELYWVAQRRVEQRAETRTYQPGVGDD